MAFPEDQKIWAKNVKLEGESTLSACLGSLRRTQTWGRCYLRISAFEVIRALPCRLGVEPGTRCAAWKKQERSHIYWPRDRCALRREPQTQRALRATAERPMVTWAGHPETFGLPALGWEFLPTASMAQPGCRDIPSNLLQGEQVIKACRLHACESCFAQNKPPSPDSLICPVPNRCQAPC